MLGSLDKNTKTIYGILIFIVAFVLILIPLISAPTSWKDYLENGLEAWYDLNETSGVIVDIWNKTYNGTNYGATRGVSGIIQNAFDFELDEKDFVNASGINLTASSGTFTFNIWYKAESYVSNVFIGVGDGYYADEGVILRYLTGDKYRIHYETNTQWDVAATFPTETWQMVTLVGNGTHFILYQNGTEIAQSAISWTYSVPRDLIVSKLFDFDGWYHDGELDEIGIYTTAKNSTEVMDLWNSGLGTNPTFAVPPDTCTCPGAGNDWEIAMSDYCNITTACDLTTGTLSFTGAGWCNCNASVDTTNLGDPGASGILYIQDSCLITID